MSKVMIIGCGGVASVAIHKCCQNSEVFSEIMIASRTLSKCDALKEKLAPTTKTIITTAKVDADCTEELIALIKQYQPDAIIAWALLLVVFCYITQKLIQLILFHRRFGIC